MEMISHQTPGMHLPVGLGAGFGEGGQKTLPVQVVVENGLTPIPAIHDVVHGPGILNTEFAAHAARLANSSAAVKCHKLGTDTFSTPLRPEAGTVNDFWFGRIVGGDFASARKQRF